MKSMMILLLTACLVAAVVAHPTGEAHSHNMSAKRVAAFLTKACDEEFMTPEKTEEVLACSNDQEARNALRACVTRSYEMAEDADKDDLRRAMCANVTPLMKVAGCMKQTYGERAKERTEDKTTEERQTEMHEKRMCIRRVMELPDDDDDL